MAESIRIIRQTIIIPEDTHETFLPLGEDCCRPLQDNSIDLGGISEFSSDYSVTRPCAAHHVLLLTLAGQGVLTANGEERRLNARDLLVAPAYTDYAYRPAQTPWKACWLHLRETPRWARLQGQAVQVRSASEPDGFLSSMQGILRESLRHGREAQRLAGLFAEQLVLYVDREISHMRESGNGDALDRLQELWNWASTHLDEPLSVAQLARHVHISPPHLHRLTRRYHGCSPMRMVFYLRMRKAEALLMQSDYPLEWIALRLGYSTPYALSNAFKRYKGVSPDHYRKDKDNHR